VFDVVTGLAMVAPSGETGVAVVEINPMVSTYGAALFVSLALASGARTRTLVLGLAMLLPFQAWSIAFDFLAQLVRIDPALALQAGLVGWKSEFVAFGYQLGSLICPVLAPVAIWAGLEKRFVDQLTTNLRSVHAGFLAE